MEVVKTLNLITSFVETLNPIQIHQGRGNPKTDKCKLWNPQP